jgi:hypothetical protein
MESGLTPALKSESSLSFVAAYFRDLKNVLLEPAVFFRSLPITGGLAVPLTFALVTHWLGSLINYFLSALTGEVGGHFFDRFMQFSSQYSSRYSQMGGGDIDSFGRGGGMNQSLLQALGAGEKAASWLWGASGILLDPFTTLVWLIFISFLVFVGARLLVKPTAAHLARFPNGVTFESAVRVVSFGMGPAIFTGLPYLGSFIAKLIYIPIVTIIGAREIYRVSNGRATAIALFPEILLWGIIGTGVIVLMAIFFKFATAMFF